MSWYRGQAVRPVAIPVGLRVGQLCRRNARGVNSDEGVPSAQLRLGRILVHELLRTAFSMESNGFHCGFLAQCTSILSVLRLMPLRSLWVASGFAEYDCCRAYTFDSTGPGAQPALDDGGPSPRSRHVPSQELATLAAAEDQDFKPLRLSHALSSVC